MLDSRFLRGPARTSVCGWTRLHSLGHFLGQYPSEDDASPQSVLFQKYSDRQLIRTAPILAQELKASSDFCCVSIDVILQWN